MNSKFSIGLKFASYALTLVTLLLAYKNNPPTWMQEIEWLDAEFQELIELQTAIFHGIVFIVMVILVDIVYSFTKLKC
ncbi:hypothetical protein MKY34_14180 [Sporosarcina sp. FSL K6-1522]|uniref:hypothetical protein n=1 Tax=Sporosarcina sp. FSL K6-1522 TaxID=2921554 RepID=UPI00315AF92A